MQVIVGDYKVFPAETEDILFTIPLKKLHEKEKSPCCGFNLILTELTFFTLLYTAV